MITLNVIDKNNISSNIYFDHLHFKFYKDKEGTSPLQHQYSLMNDYVTENPSQIRIPLGYECPNKCLYCPQRKIPKSKINISRLPLFIHNLTTEYSTINQIHFIGGEPLLDWKVIEFIIDQFRDRFQYSIITNGIYLDSNKIKFLIDNKFNVVLSHDGESQKLQRGSDPLDEHDDLFSLIQQLSENTNFGIMSILCNNSITTKERWNYFNNLPLKISNVNIKSMIPYKKEHISLVPGINDWDKYFVQLINDIYTIQSKYASDKGDDELMTYMLYLLRNKNTAYDPESTKCPIFNKEIFTINTSGYLQYCHNCDQHFTDEQTQIYKRMDRVEKCKYCPMVLLCTSSCRLLDDECFKIACKSTFYHHLAYFTYFVHQVFGYYITDIEGEFTDG